MALKNHVRMLGCAKESARHPAAPVIPPKGFGSCRRWSVFDKPINFEATDSAIYRVTRARRLLHLNWRLTASTFFFPTGVADLNSIPQQRGWKTRHRKMFLLHTLFTAHHKAETTIRFLKRQRGKSTGEAKRGHTGRKCCKTALQVDLVSHVVTVLFVREGLRGILSNIHEVIVVGLSAS